MRILIVTPSPPEPPHWGFNIRVHQFLKHLGKRHEVSVLCYTEPDQAEAIEMLEPLCASLHTVPRPDERRQMLRRRQLRSLFSGHSFHGHHLWSPAMQAAIDRVIAERDPDLIQVESSRLGVFRFGRQSVTILDEHNLEYELLERMSRTDRSVFRKAYTWLESVKFRREEQAWWRRFDGCILTSDREQAVVAHQVRDLPTAVVPNGVDVEYFRPRDEPVDPFSIVFTGLMTYRPNADAAVYFIREVLPLVRRSRPNARFTAVGWGLPPDLARLLGDGVTHTGRVPDVRPYLAQAGVVVVPLRMGSGTRLKVLEGLAMGKGLVSTTLGCEGVSVEPGRHMLVADDPNRFAASVVELMDDAALRTRFGVAGRELVVREYSWSSVVQGLERFHEVRVASTRPVGRAVAVAL